MSYQFNEEFMTSASSFIGTRITGSAIALDLRLFEPVDVFLFELLQIFHKFQECRYSDSFHVLGFKA